RRGGLQHVINRHQVRGPFKISSHEASAMIAGKDFAQPNAGIDDLRVLGPAGNAEAATGPYADVPRLAVKRLRGLLTGGDTADKKQKCDELHCPSEANR